MPLRKQPSGLFLGIRAERFSAEPLFREAKWNPCPSASFTDVPTRDVFHFSETSELAAAFAVGGFAAAHLVGLGAAGANFGDLGGERAV